MGKITFPLDPAATKAADDAFYAAHPEFVREDGTRIPLSATDPKQADLRREWIRLYLDALKGEPPSDPADDVDPVDPVQPCPGEGPCADCTPISTVKIVELEFVNDHRRLKNWETDWTNGGARYSKPDWTPAMAPPNPVSVTMELPVEVKIDFTVHDDDACPEDGDVRARAGGLTKQGPAPTAFAPSATPTEISPRPSGDLPRKLMRVRYEPGWMAFADRTHHMGRTSNEMFVTWGPSLLGERQEDGATLKRMSAAMDMATPAGSAREFDVLKHLFAKFKRYVLGFEHLNPSEQAELQANPTLWEELNSQDWPRYFRDDVGAWPIADFERWGAECQAICRFIRGIMRQLGARSRMEFRTYTADFRDPETPINAPKPRGPRKDRIYLLADRPVTRWRTYWKPVEVGEQAEIGWNNFEAYLKVTPDDGGPTRLFGGGVGLLREDRNPLHVFDALVECKQRQRIVTHSSGARVEQRGYRVMKLHRYHDRGGWSGHLP